MSNVNSGNTFVPVSNAQARVDISNNRTLYQNINNFPFVPPAAGPTPTNWVPPTYPPTITPAPVFDLLTNIKDLQSLEEYLFSTLELANLNDPTDLTQQNDIIAQINNLSDLRNSLFGQLGKIYVNLDKNSQVQRRALTDQITTTNMMESQLNNLKAGVDDMLGARADKIRMVEIGEYEYLRYSKHKSTMQLVAFTSIAILFFSYCLKTELIPVAISKLGIMLTLSIGGVLIVKAGWDMITRSNQNYNRFEQPNIVKVGPAGGGDTVWQHDKKFFSKLLRGADADYKKGWGDINKEMRKMSKAEKKLKQAADIAACNSKTPPGSYQYINGRCVKNSAEGFQVVRAFQEKNDLGGAPFN